MVELADSNPSGSYSPNWALSGPSQIVPGGQLAALGVLNAGLGMIAQVNTSDMCALFTHQVMNIQTEYLQARTTSGFKSTEKTTRWTGGRPYSRRRRLHYDNHLHNYYLAPSAPAKTGPRQQIQVAPNRRQLR